ncbi:MAG: hypothetical protein HZA49_05155 [Planctomycetes bacterium]|nr:hypothetical protein [Planctomycetota bacterium]
MALSRQDNITPEEHLLRLIEKPAGLEETPSPNDGLTIVLGKKKRLGPRVVINGIILFLAAFVGFGKQISLKTVNRLCLVVITVLLGYAVWSVVSADTSVIEEPNIRNPRPDDITEQPDISEYYSELDKRDIFMDMYKPPVIETVRTPAFVPTGTQSTSAEPKPAIADVLKNLKLIGVIWEPQSAASGLALIDNGSDVLCLAKGDTFRINVEQAGNMKNVNIEIKEISKDKVTLRHENEDGILMLTDK